MIAAGSVAVNCLLRAGLGVWSPTLAAMKLRQGWGARSRLVKGGPPAAIPEQRACRHCGRNGAGLDCVATRKRSAELA